MDFTNKGISDQISDAAEGISRLNLKIEGPTSGGSETTPAPTRQEDKIRYNTLVTQGKEMGRQGHVEEALALFKDAYAIHSSEKLLKRIEKLQTVIQEFQSREEEEEDEEEEEEEEEEEDDGLVEVGDGFRLAKEIYDALYPYQKEALLWLWGLYKNKRGGILGDDMGLGKTIQIISFLAGMFDGEYIKSALIVMPVSLITNWEKEFHKWAPGIRVRAFHGTSKKERQRNLEKIQRKDGVCLTTYGMVMSNVQLLSTNEFGRTFTWDYIILDEGHKIKNTTKTSKSIREVPAKHHFILSGTPIQNNLKEMWALFDFVTEGQLLGTSRTFKKEYEHPIVRARERDASAYEKRIGAKMSESLRELIAPCFLRRTKAMVLENKKNPQDNPDGELAAASASVERLPEKLTRKNDFIVWLFLSEAQLKIYKDFIGLERIKEMLMSKRSPLAELNVMKKICDHPRLLSPLACQHLGLDEECTALNMDDDKENVEFNQMRRGSGPSDKALIVESGKLVFLVALLDNLKSEGHRCLIFSQSRKMLDIIERVLSHRDHKMLRIDGTISSTAERQHLITTFQKDPSYSCFLLTTQVGGVGINLTAADRVVIFDPSWNPANDAQAVDRVYRIGQKRSVVIYRLITCATLEEKIYCKQIFKDALMKQTTGMSKNPFRYFSRQELQDMFTLDKPDYSRTQVQLEAMHAKHRKTDHQLEKHVTFLQSLNIFGLSDHDLMYSQEAVEAPEETDTAYNDVIHARVQQAQNLVAMESGIRGVTNPATATCPRPPKTAPLRPGGTGTADLPRYSLPNGGIPLNAKAKIQAKINQFELFKPSREDTKRYLPRNVPGNSPEQSDFIDLSTPPPKPQPLSDSQGLVDLTESEECHEQFEQKFSTLDIGEDQTTARQLESSITIDSSSAGSVAEEHTASPAKQSGSSAKWHEPESCDVTTVQDNADEQRMAALMEEECARQTPKRRSLNPKRRRSMSQRLMVRELDDSDEDDLHEEVANRPAVPVSGDVLEGSAETNTNEERPAANGDHSVGQSSDESISEGERASDALDMSQRSSLPMPGVSLRRLSDEDVFVNEEDEDNNNLTSTPTHEQCVPRSSGEGVSISEDEESVGSPEEENTAMKQAASPLLHEQPVTRSNGEGVSMSEDEESVGSTEVENTATNQAGSLLLHHESFDHSSGEVASVHESAESSEVEDIDNDQATVPQHEQSSDRLSDFSGSAGSSDESNPAPMLGHSAEESFSDENNQPGSGDSADVNENQVISSPMLDHSAEISFSVREDENNQSGSSDSSDVNEGQVISSPMLDNSVEESFSVREDENNQPESESSKLNDEDSEDDDDDTYLSATSNEEFQSFTTPVSDSVMRNRSRVRVRRIDSSSEEDDGSPFESVVVSSTPINDPACTARDGGCNNRCPTGVHTSRVINIQRCACVVDDDGKFRYEVLLARARELQRRSKPGAALEMYLQALQIMDSDLDIHRQVLLLNKAV